MSEPRFCVAYADDAHAAVASLQRALRGAAVHVELEPWRPAAGGALVRTSAGAIRYDAGLVAVTPVILPYAAALAAGAGKLIPVLLRDSFLPWDPALQPWFDLRDPSLASYRRELRQLIRRLLLAAGDPAAAVDLAGGAMVMRPADVRLFTLDPPTARPGVREVEEREILRRSTPALHRRDRMLLGGEHREPQPPTAAAVDASPPAAAAPRFADFTFYEADGDRAREKVAAGQCLRAGRWYDFEVAVRRQPTGIPAVDQSRRSIREPSRQTPVKLYVTAAGDGFEVANPVQPLLLPVAGDSIDNAVFAVRPLAASRGTDDVATLRVTLYYEFNLLEDVSIEAEIVRASADSTAPRHRPHAPLVFRPKVLPSDELDFVDVTPRAAHIKVEKSGDQFVLRFLFKRRPEDSAAEGVPFTAKMHLRDSDLAVLLADTRDLWTDIAIRSTFARQLDGDVDFKHSLARLSALGQRLWNRLFREQIHGALATVGDWLAEHPLEPDGIVQIWIDEDARNFVFPWALLFDRPAPGDDSEVDEQTPEGFWGTRYRLELRYRRPASPADGPIRIGERLSIGFMLWDRFTYAQEQIGFMQELERQGGERLAVGRPLTAAAECYQLMQDGSADILYFYSHGHTRRPRQAAAEADFGSRFASWYESLAAGSELADLWQPLYQGIRDAEREPDRSYIQLTSGRLYLDELFGRVRKLARDPLVILNMCESAQITPTLSEGFVHFFLDRGAAGVLGTECPMTIHFAHPFAKRLMADIVRGEEVGTALLRARRALLRERNPLGLAYTFFGPVTLRFEPPSLQVPAAAAIAPPAV